MKYHSALNKDIDILEETLLYANKSGVAFKHDITSIDIPKHFDVCDVFYTEISWTAGLDKFNERAGSNQSYLAYMFGIECFINHYKDAPTFVVAGRKESKMLPIGYKLLPTRLNGAPAMIYCYNISDDDYQNYFKSNAINNNCEALIKELSVFYNVIGDYCCGYGRTGKIFADAGKQFVMSDYNGKCITYIKNHYENI